MLPYRKSSVMTVPLLRWISDFNGKPVLSEIQMRASEPLPFVAPMHRNENRRLTVDRPAADLLTGVWRRRVECPPEG